MDLNNCEGLKSPLSDLLPQCDLSDADGAWRDGVDIRGGLALSRRAQRDDNAQRLGRLLRRIMIMANSKEALPSGLTGVKAPAKHS